MKFLNVEDSTTALKNLSTQGDWPTGNHTTPATATDGSPGNEYIFDQIYVQIIFFVLYSIVFCFCFFGNLAVVLAVTLHWRMRNTTKFCLGNLAFANLCVGVFCVYQNLSTYIADSWVFGVFLCKMYHFINSLSHAASILILVTICVERYLAILHPFTCRRILTICRLRIIIVGVWIVSAIISAPRLYYITAYSIPSATPGKDEIICAPQQDLYNNKTSDLIHFALLLVLPLIVMSVLYTRVGLFLWRSCALFEGTYSEQRSLVRGEQTAMSDFSTPGTSSLTSDAEAREKKMRCRSAFGLQFLTTRFYRRYVLRRRSSSRATGSGDVAPASSRASAGRFNSKRMAHPSSSRTCSTFARKKWSRILNRSNQSYKSSKPTLRSVLKSRRRQQRVVCKFGRERVVKKNSRLSNCSRKFNLRSSRGKRREAQSNAFYPPNYPRARNSKEAKRQHRIVPRLCVLNRKNMIKPRQAVVRMLIVIVVTFAICNLPFHVRKIFQNYYPHYDFGSQFSHLLTPLTFLLMYANCAINPILYGFMSKNFRESFKDLMKGRLRRKNLSRRT